MTTNFPYGVTSFGMPVYGGITTTGIMHFVHPTLGSDANDGLSTDTPLATIQAGLDKCRANKDDYVILMPCSTDYDITATLTMSNARVHLVCPTGIGWGGMPGNTARIHMNTAATDFITVTADNVEIAGIFFKADATSTTGNIITLSSTRWCANIHDNFFGMYATAATNNYGIYGAGACNHCVIYNNYFTNYSPGLNTGTNNDIAAFIDLASGSSTRNIVRNNVLVTGVNTTVGAAILLGGTGSLVQDNVVIESVANGGNDAGILTLGISSGVDSVLIRNTVSMAVGNIANAIDGATANQSYILNYGGNAGATALT
jgi:hypothetical protein